MTCTSCWASWPPPLLCHVPRGQQMLCQSHRQRALCSSPILGLGLTDRTGSTGGLSPPKLGCAGLSLCFLSVSAVFSLLCPTTGADPAPASHTPSPGGSAAWLGLFRDVPRAGLSWCPGPLQLCRAGAFEEPQGLPGAVCEAC